MFINKHHRIYNQYVKTKCIEYRRTSTVGLFKRRVLQCRPQVAAQRVTARLSLQYRYRYYRIANTFAKKVIEAFWPPIDTTETCSRSVKLCVAVFQYYKKSCPLSRFHRPRYRVTLTYDQIYLILTLIDFQFRAS